MGRTRKHIECVMPACPSRGAHENPRTTWGGGARGSEPPQYPSCRKIRFPKPSILHPEPHTRHPDLQPNAAVESCKHGRLDWAHRNVQRFRDGLALKAHRLLYHSTLGLRVIQRESAHRVARAVAPEALFPSRGCPWPEINVLAVPILL